MFAAPRHRGLQQQDGEDETPDQPLGVAALGLLAFEKQRGHKLENYPQTRCRGVRWRTGLTLGVRSAAMNLEPKNTDSEIRNGSGTARVLASLVIVALAVITILVVLDVIPRSAFTEM